MITVSEIRKAIVRKLRELEIGFVTGEDLEQSREYEEAVGCMGEDRDILQVMIEPSGFTTKSAGRLTEKSILVDIAYLCGMNTKRSEIQDVLEKIDGVIRPVLNVKDRNFTIDNADSNITDNVGHYVFTIRYTDGDPIEVKEPIADSLEFEFEEV